MRSQLETSVELLERIRAKHGSSWYGLGRLLDAHRNTIASWKAGRTIVDRKFAPRIAALLEESPEYVLLCLEHEREPSPEMRKLWRRIAALVTSSAAAVLLALPFAALPQGPADAASTVYYGKFHRWLRRWFGLQLLDRHVRSVIAPAF